MANPKPKPKPALRAECSTASNATAIDVDKSDANSGQASSPHRVDEKEWQVAQGDDWDVDGVALDSQRRSQGVGRISGDIAMSQAKLTGWRRGRADTPSSSPIPNKTSRRSDEPERKRKEPAFSIDLSTQASQDMADLASQHQPPTSSNSLSAQASQDMLEHSSRPPHCSYAPSEQASQSPAEQPSQHQPPEPWRASAIEAPGSTDASQLQLSSRKVDYESWDVKRYQHAVTLDSRRRFWAMASDAAKQRVTNELLQLSPSNNTLKQARTQGWISKLDLDERV